MENSFSKQKTEHWINDGHLPTDIYFVKTVQNAKTLREIRRIFLIKEIGIIVNHDMILESWKKLISKGNTRLESRLNREKINLGFNIKNSPIFDSNSF